MKHVWSVVPLIYSSERAYRLNLGPYVFGKCSGLDEYAYMQGVKRHLESLGVNCCLDLVEVKPNAT